jgi:hypothetical protein
MFYDRKYDAQLNAAAEAAGEAEAAVGGGGGGGMDDLLGGDGAGEDLMGDLGGEPGGDEGGDELDLGGEEAPAEEEDDSVLLAEPPAKRDLEEDGSYLTAGAKGKRYTPAKRDKRKDAAGRTKNYKRATMPEISPRTFYPGWKGSTGMNQLRNVHMEDQRSNYHKSQDLQERRLWKTGHEIEKLIEGLETKENDDEAQ